MNRNSLIRTAAVSLVTLAAASAMAQGDDGYATYRRAVLGDSQVAQPSDAPSASVVVPGPNAAHLIYLGVDKTEAIARARATGEQPSVQAVAPAPTHVSGLQGYRRNFLGEGA